MKLSDAYTLADVAKILGLHHEYVRRLAQDYGLLRRKVGSSYVLTLEDIEVLKKRPTYGSRRGRNYDRYGKRGEK